MANKDHTADKATSSIRIDADLHHALAVAARADRTQIYKVAEAAIREWLRKRSGRRAA